MRYPTRTAQNGRALLLRGVGVAWPNGIVPHEIPPGYSNEQELIITSAMRQLENTVAINNFRCVQFRPKISSDPYYITIVNEQGCSSYVGQNPHVVLNRTVTLQSSGCLTAGVIIHELLHTFGFEHEQSRPDRDDYVRINWDNIQREMQYNFDKYDNIRVNTLNTPYDYRSLMHYGSTAFAINDSPTIEPIQSGVTIGQRNNLSAIDIQAVRLFYNCTASGITLPPTTTPSTANLYTTNAAYSSVLTTNSRRFSRAGEENSNYYYEIFLVTVLTSGYYRFRSNSIVDTYGYLYTNNFIPSSPTLNLLAQDDDTGGSLQFQFTLYLQSTVVYMFVVTTYSQNITGPYTVIASGLTRVNFVPITNTSILSSTTNIPIASSSINPSNNIITNYINILTNRSSTFIRHGGSGTFYYEAIQVTVYTTGIYTFRSICTIDTYGYLYVNSFNPNNVTSNLVTSNDDDIGTVQFLMTYRLEAGTTYILIFTTFNPDVTTSFSINVVGPANVNLLRMNLTSTVPSTTRWTTLLTTRSPSNVSSIITSYSSITNSDSSTFTRNGGTGRFYYEAIQVTVYTTGIYTFRSICTIDAFGYLYVNSFNPNDVTSNLVAFNDDDIGTNQFLMTYRLEAGITYILIFTTYSSGVTTSFSINVAGPASVYLLRMNLASIVPSTSRMTTLLTTSSPSNVSNIIGVVTNYSSALNIGSSTFTRNGGSGTFYYEAIQVTVYITGIYTFRSICTIDTYGYLYVNSFNPNDVISNLVTSNDDDDGNYQFLLTYRLEAGITYILIFTTYRSDVTTSFSINVAGPAGVNLLRMNFASIVPSTTNRLNVSSITGIATNYSSILNSGSSTFTRHEGSGTFYYKAIQVAVYTTGIYTFRSICTIDTYGYLYINSFNPNDVRSNLITFNDDNDGNYQFLITYRLQAGTTYILIFTTYSPGVTTSFSITALGPERLNLVSIDTGNGAVTVSTATASSSSTRENAVGCNRINNQWTCPAQVSTNGIIVTVDPINRTLNGEYFPPNNTFFNLNDSSRVNGYVRTVTVQYFQTGLPITSTRIWIYGIIPILGGYIACSEYLIPSSQISTSQLIQTYNITDNRINVFDGTYVGIGIQDRLTSIATTSGTMALGIRNANLTSNTPLYFQPDNSRFGIKLSYTIVT
ncbi:unnamed protein product [Rotaria sordida]|uniref:Metalloendopeptidase n=2 Tax=Rotaria sordida TaxID=392033 RepID=A0A818WWI6_9BILA|nr:unnamed protein product [Rotaria sordida]